MSRSASSDVEESMSGRTGVGVHLTRRSDGSFFVRDLVPNGSAAMSGQVQIGDFIMAIDGEPLLGRSMEFAASLITGEIGTQVNLTLLRYDEWMQTYNEDGDLIEESQTDQAYLIEVILERIQLSHVTGQRSVVPLFGIGLGLDPCPQGGVVQMLVPGGAAAQSGEIGVGDVVVSVNNERIIGWTSTRLRNCFLGPFGTKISLGIIKATQHPLEDGLLHLQPVDLVRGGGVLMKWYERPPRGFFGGARRASPSLPSPSTTLSEIPSSERPEDGEGQEEDFSCIICYENLKFEDGNAVSLPCRHLFHFHCIREWFHRNASCPVCKFEIPGVLNLHRNNSFILNNAITMEEWQELRRFRIIQYSSLLRMPDCVIQ